MTIDKLIEEAFNQIAELKYNPDKIPTISFELDWEDYLEVKKEYARALFKVQGYEIKPKDLTKGTFLLCLNLPTIAHINLISNGK